MAIDQREALIAAVRAQVEKEKAAKAAKLKKEQEAAKLAGVKVSDDKSEDKPKYKTLSAEDLAKIEEKKRRKYAAEHGIDYDAEEAKKAEEEAKNAAEEAKKAEEIKKAAGDSKKADDSKKAKVADDANKKKAEEAKKADKNDGTVESLGMSVGIQPDKSGKSLSGVGAKKEEEGLNKKEGGLGLKLKLGDDKAEDAKKDVKKTIDSGKQNADEKARLRPEKVVSGNDTVKVIEDDNVFEEEGNVTKKGNTTVISEDTGWKATTENRKPQNPDDIINIVPNRAAPSSDVKSMYDLDDDGEDSLGAEISKLADFSDGDKKAEGKAESKDATAASDDKKQDKTDIANKKLAEEEARKKAAADAAANAKKKAEEASAKKMSAAEEALKKAEAQRNKLKEAERSADERERRIAEAQAKKRAEEAAKKKAEEAAKKKAEEEAKRKALEEERKKAAEEARRKAEEEARRKAKEEAQKVVDEAKKSASEIEKKLADAKKEEEKAVKNSADLNKKLEENAKKRADEEAKLKAEEESLNKAKEEARADAEAAAKKKAEERTKKRAEFESKAKADKDARDKRLADAKKAEEEAKKGVETAKKAVEDAKKGVEDAKKKIEEITKQLEAAKKAETEASKKVDEANKKVDEANKKVADEAKKVEETGKKIAEEEKAAVEAEKKLKSEEDAAAKVDADSIKKAEFAVVVKFEEFIKNKAESEKTRKSAEEADKKALDEAKKAEEAAKKAVADITKEVEIAKKAIAEAEKAVTAADTLKLDIRTINAGRLPMAASYLVKYTSVEVLGDRIVTVFDEVSKAKGASRNLLLMGEHGFGLTSVGEDFARSFYDMGVCKEKTIAKIKASALNKVKLSENMAKLKGGCLVVENSGLIAPDRLKELLNLTAPENNDIIMILTGEQDSIKRLLNEVKETEGKFEHQIRVNSLKNEDMVNIAKGYVEQRNFKADSDFDGVIKNLLMAMESGNIDRMLKAVDEAMVKCEEREKAKGSNDKKLLAADFK